MATRDRTVESLDGRTGARTTGPDLSRYDIILVAIPLAFLAALLVGQLLSLSMQATVVVGAALGALVVVDALFVNPPRPGRRTP